MQLLLWHCRQYGGFRRTELSSWVPWLARGPRAQQGLFWLSCDSESIAFPRISRQDKCHTFWIPSWPHRDQRRTSVRIWGLITSGSRAEWWCGWSIFPEAEEVVWLRCLLWASKLRAEPLIWTIFVTPGTTPVRVAGLRWSWTGGGVCSKQTTNLC